MVEKRRYKRIKTNTPLTYVCLDRRGNPIDQGIARTLDISQGGLLMETKVPIEAKFIQLTSIGIKNELIKIKVKVAYCREEKSKNFHVGVRFLENNERIREIIVGMIKAFSLRNNMNRNYSVWIGMWFLFKKKSENV